MFARGGERRKGVEVVEICVLDNMLKKDLCYVCL